MSSKMNHRKRSHRSNYRSRAWNGSRRSVIKPTVKKNGFMQAVHRIAKLLSKMRGKGGED